MATKNQDKNAAAGAEEPSAPKSKVAWILGWVVTPGVILGGIFTSGIYVGANLEESWVTRGVVWLFG